MASMVDLRCTNPEPQTSPSGHKRPMCGVREMSAITPKAIAKADVGAGCAVALPPGSAVSAFLVTFRVIVLQKSKVAGLRIFRENTKRETIADSYNVNRVIEVACEFNVRRRGPSHLYTKAAPLALRIFEHQCKTTFATQSG
jgi:hypothetical protein